jgi:hypothetical protein
MSYNPIFHHDGSITYWVNFYGWFHRVHPAKISAKDVASWRAKDRRKWGDAMLKRGFIRKGGKWIPAHNIAST